MQARVEHPFRLLKRQFGCETTRSSGPAKIRAKLSTPSTLGKLFLVRRRLMA
jgi:IS5 family transposase